MKQTPYFARAGVLRGLVLWSSLLLAPTAVLPQDAAPAAARTLNTLDVTTLDGERVLVTLTLSDTAPEPVIFTVDKPARLSLDLADTRLALPERFKRVGAGKVRSIAAAEAQGRARIVIELSELTPYNVRTDGNKVLVEIQGSKLAAARKAKAAWWSSWAIRAPWWTCARKAAASWPSSATPTSPPNCSSGWTCSTSPRR